MNKRDRYKDEKWIDSRAINGLPTSQRADDISITSKKRDFLFFAYIFETLTDFGKLLDNGHKRISFPR